MKNRIICVVVCMMMLVGCLGLCSCGNYRVFYTTFTYSWAQIKLPDGTIIQGKVDNWTDYEGDQLRFDYKKKDGRCTTTNAMAILHMAGLD